MEASSAGDFFGKSGDAPRGLRAEGIAAVRGRLVPPVDEAIVADHAGDPQPVIAENAIAPELLHAAVAHVTAPAGYGVFVAPDGERQHLVRIGDALEPLDRDEAIHLLERRTELGRVIEVGLALSVGGPDLEDDGDHARPFLRGKPPTRPSVFGPRPAPDRLRDDTVPMLRAKGCYLLLAFGLARQ